MMLAKELVKKGNQACVVYGPRRLAKRRCRMPWRCTLTGQAGLWSARVHTEEGKGDKRVKGYCTICTKTFEIEKSIKKYRLNVKSCYLFSLG